MANDNDILEVRFVGNDINPSAVRPREIADLVISFEKALLIEIKERNPHIDTEQVLFTFEQLKDQSLSLGFSPKVVKEVVVASYTLISTSFQTGDFSELSNKAIKELKTFTSFSKKYSCNGQFNLNGETLSSFTPQTDIPYNKKPIVKSEIKLFGKVIDSGGDNPNVHLKINDDLTIIFSTTEEHAKQLAHKLYEKVSLIGEAKWDAETYQITDFKLREILDFKAGSTFNAIKELRDLSSGYWDKYNTNDDINNQLLRD